MSREDRAKEFMRNRARNSRGRGCYWCDRIPEEVRAELVRCVFEEEFLLGHVHQWLLTEFEEELAAMNEPYRRRQSLMQCLADHKDRWNKRASRDQ